jgi:hypothetical protein
MMMHKYEVIIRSVADTAREFNDPIPEPKWRRLLYA